LQLGKIFNLWQASKERGAIQGAWMEVVTSGAAICPARFASMELGMLRFGGILPAGCISLLAFGTENRRAESRYNDSFQ